MKLSEFIDSINANNDGFTMSAIVDLESGADNPNAKYVLERNNTIIGMYDNSIKAKEGYEAAKQLLVSEGFLEKVATPNIQVVEDENQEVEIPVEEETEKENTETPEEVNDTDPEEIDE